MTAAAEDEPSSTSAEWQRPAPPAVAQHPHLAAHLAGSAAPLPPSGGTVTAALLAALQEELTSLASAASRASMACEQSAPVAKALRVEVLRELDRLKASELALQQHGCCTRELPTRVVELRAVAAKALDLLEDALAAGEPLNAEQAFPARPLVQHPSCCRPTVDACPLPLSPLLHRSVRSVDSALASGVPAPCSAAPPAVPAAPLLADALGNLAAGMRQALDEIHRVRSTVTPFFGRSGH